MPPQITHFSVSGLIRGAAGVGALLAAEGLEGGLDDGLALTAIEGLGPALPHLACLTRSGTREVHSGTKPGAGRSLELFLASSLTLVGLGAAFGGTGA